MNASEHILLINPPVYDFAAYDLWSKPLGLLYLSTILKNQNTEISFLDYMDRYSPLMPKENVSRETFHNSYGCGHYLKKEIAKPKALKNIPRKFSRYGLPEELAKEFLKSLKKPDLIIITSIMTYWYMGIFEVIDTIIEIFPKTPIALGGIYASLCREHFLDKIKKDYKEKIKVFCIENNKISKEDLSVSRETLPIFLIKGNLSNLDIVFHTVFGKAKIKSSALSSVQNQKYDFSQYPAPDFSYYNKKYAVLRMSMGCPFRCVYCAQNIICGDNFIAKHPNIIFNEILDFARSGIKNIVFYDDALLYQSNLYIKPLLKMIIKNNLDIKIHTPNGLHVNFLDLELAELMKKAGFIMPRFSLETSDPDLQKNTGGKVNNSGFEKAVEILKKAGFAKGEFIIYLLMGIKGQSLQEVEKTIRYVNDLGGIISLSEYSVIPQTKDFENIDKKFILEPLYHNKSIYPFFSIDDWKEIYKIKLLAKNLNKSLVL
jgi:radical SAM superfamily enzyme YgiQ (UPF0313 family)